MRRTISIVLLAAGLAGCDMFGLFIDGLKHAQAVETDLERVTGIRPKVGFDWKNGSLELVTVTFPRVYEAKPLGELAQNVRVAVEKEFKQKPDDIVLGFSLGSSHPNRTTQVQ